jgi:hypothetical protein
MAVSNNITADNIRKNTKINTALDKLKLIADHANPSNTFGGVCPDIILANNLIVELATLAKYGKISIITNNGANTSGIPLGKNKPNIPHPCATTPKKFDKIDRDTAKNATTTIELVNV